MFQVFKKPEPRRGSETATRLEMDFFESNIVALTVWECKLPGFLSFQKITYMG